MLRYRPGQLVEGSPAALEPDVHEAIGELTRALHAVCPDTAPDPLAYPRARALKLTGLLEPLRPLVTPATWRAAAAAVELATASVAPEPLVPTHGDLTSRNWLVHDGASSAPASPHVALIDFGRFDLRPWYSDVVRLYHALGPADARLVAFLAGVGREAPWLGSDAGWWTENLLAAVSTVTWATRVGDAPFADEGREMLDRTLAAARFAR